MTITTTQEKRRLIITLGEHEAPVRYEWEVMTFVRDGELDVVPPTKGFVAATAEEVAAHLDTALLAQRDALAAKAGEQADRILDMEQHITVVSARVHAAEEERDHWQAQYERLLGEVEPT